MKKRKFTWKPGYNYLLVLGIFLCLCLINSFYSFYKETKENKNALYLEGVNLVYTITSPSLSDNRIVVSGNSSTTVSFQITSTNAKDTEYELYYQIVESLTNEQMKNVIVECNKASSQDLPTGSIPSSEIKTVVVAIKNNNDSSVTVEFGVQGGLSGRVLVLEQGHSIPLAVSTVDLVDTIKTEAVLDNIASTYVSSSSGVDFSQPSSSTNGRGLYILHGTENTQNPIMYYRGAVQNNNIKFANFCWKIVRTTDTGGVKLIYNGTPDENGQCTTSDDSRFIGTSQFNPEEDDVTYLGYMYGEPTGDQKVETHENIYDSTVKTFIDDWYSKNMTAYTEKLEDTVWCNDRTIGKTDMFSTDYAAYVRLHDNYAPSFGCTNVADRFTVSEENGNGKLTYPVALLTVDEFAFAGACSESVEVDEEYYLEPPSWMSVVTMSPGTFFFSSAAPFHAQGNFITNLWTSSTKTSFSIRPAISLKDGTKVIEGGDGTSTNPWVVAE